MCQPFCRSCTLGKRWRSCESFFSFEFVHCWALSSKAFPSQSDQLPCLIYKVSNAHGHKGEYRNTPSACFVTFRALLRGAAAGAPKVQVSFDLQKHAIISYLMCPPSYLQHPSAVKGVVLLLKRAALQTISQLWQSR